MWVSLLAATLVASPKTIVLTYHDMVPKRDSRSLWFDCTPGELRQQLDWLSARGAVFVSTLDLFAAVKHGKSISPKAVAITFADNYRGFLTAWPILKARKVPVTLFVHTGFVGSKVGRPKMTWTELQALAKDPLVTVSSQTVTHPADLTALTDAAIMKEFLDSRRSLEKHVPGPGATLLAYPNGKFDSRVAKLAKSAGYQMAFTEEQRPAQAAPDLWRVPRWVHTKWKSAWDSVHGKQPSKSGAP